MLVNTPLKKLRTDGDRASELRHMSFDTSCATLLAVVDYRVAAVWFLFSSVSPFENSLAASFPLKK